jgi:hypothetical protein
VVDELVLFVMSHLCEGCFALAALERLSRHPVSEGRRRRDHGVDVGDVLLQIRCGSRPAEKFTTVRTSGRFWQEHNNQT